MRSETTQVLKTILGPVTMKFNILVKHTVTVFGSVFANNLLIKLHIFVKNERTVPSISKGRARTVLVGSLVDSTVLRH